LSGRITVPPPPPERFCERRLHTVHQPRVGTLESRRTLGGPLESRRTLGGPLEPNGRGAHG
jgi:hypothetical protein